MVDLFTYDPLATGAKGLVFIGDKLLVYRRDTNTKIFPLYLDLPGGGAEVNESPFETFQREVREEFGVHIERENVVWWKRLPAILDTTKYAYMPVVKLPESTGNDIVLGNEGTEWHLMSVEEFMQRDDVWPALKERVATYVAATTH